MLIYLQNVQFTKPLHRSGALAKYLQTSSDARYSMNPFHMPTDEEVFALRDEEQQRKRQERERARELHVWEKGVTRRTLGDQHEEEEQKTKLNLVTSATRDRRKEKENMADFIAKK
eukprot:977205-Prymnesium_polylepis.1